MLILGIFFNIIGFALARESFFIGAIFESENNEAELAFRTAVERANIYERSFELEPIVEYANSDDSFIMEKTACKLISEGVIAIFGPQTSGMDIVASICNTLEIPHFVYDWTYNEATTEKQHASMTLNLHPDNLQFSRGLAEFTQGFGWRSFTVVYETDWELQRLQDILQIGDPSSNPTTIRQLTSDEDQRPFLKSIKTSTDNCLVLLCSIERILPLLRQANDLKMLGEYQSIFIPHLDTHTIDLQEILQVNANITTIRLMDPTDYNVQNIVHEWEEREKREGRYYRVLPTQVKTNMILMNEAVWLFAKGLGELQIAEELQAPKVECSRNRAWPFGRRIYEFIKGISREGATGRIDFNEYGQRSFFTFRFMELDPQGFIDLATWDPVNGVNILTSEDQSKKRQGEKIMNKTFIITSRLGAPFLSEREPKNGEKLEGNARYEGYSMDLIDAIANLLNFKYEFQLAPDGKYGAYDKKTQQWDGLVRQLIDGNADLGICDLTMTSLRRQAVDFTPPFMTLGISILFSKPEIPPPNLFSFLSPFSLDVWIYMATAYLMVSFLLFIIARMAPADWENPHPCKEPEEVENAWTIMNATWLTMGSIMGQGCDILPKATSTRLVTGMWWFFALMMLNSYTANLAAFLTMSRMENSIESAEDLAAQTKIKYGTVFEASTYGFFKGSNFSTFQRMWAAMESATPSVFTKGNDEGVDRVLKGKRLYAFLMESTTLEYIVERKCELVQVGGWLDYKTYGIAMPFNSPYRKLISGAVLKLGESGSLSELKRKWWKEMHGGGNCSKAEGGGGGEDNELKLENVGGVFLVLGIGLFSALILGLMEFLWNVKSVAIEEKISLKDAFIAETTFALKFWVNTKPVHTSSDHSSRSSKRSRSSSTSSLHSKRSLKSFGLSSVLPSLKSSKSANALDRLSVHEKLRKISSMFSMKSHGTEPEEAVMQIQPLNLHIKVDKSTQMDVMVEAQPPEEPHRHRHHHHHRKHQDRDSKVSGKTED